ncbi:unnamed protein product [Microthlaspi erraticum]|uniref:Uncharacterized protein n=1 Tax=Microthlaspi erraticum TaxID=1685480 RepID=A0A6D2JK51_9BRAS|nr:unnamed protein product [Microthlaspi erraticum]
MASFKIWALQVITEKGSLKRIRSDHGGEFQNEVLYSEMTRINLESSTQGVMKAYFWVIQAIVQLQSLQSSVQDDYGVGQCVLMIDQLRPWETLQCIMIQKSGEAEDRKQRREVEEERMKRIQ